VAVLDLDRFKLVNDSLGHAAGDALLVAVARRIEGSLRAGDLVARFAGNEFTLLVSPVAGSAEATQIVGRVRSELARPFEVDGVETFVAVTAGLAVADEVTASDELVRDAATALHHAKAVGRGGMELFRDGMRARAVTTLELGTALRRAIERGEFVMHYQPVVALGDGRVEGFEALVRWNHPERGLVLPGDFIPLAEQMQLIGALGRLVRQAACEQLAAWRSQLSDDSTLWMSVNVSGLEFARHEFGRELRVLLRTARLPARALRLEITESVLMDSDERIAATLDDLRRLGLSLDIDDFGTGYSSLSYLQQLPVNALKIDRAFVARLGRHERDEAFVETILVLARKLGLTVVAEGVETKEQLAILRRLGCDAAQGFLFSRAVPVEQATALLARSSLFTEAPALLRE
jgi:diguanylate cyclase (GGDEF)-like protein